MMRVILDTNVLIAAYWARSSASARLIQACMDGIVQAQYTPQIRAEIEYVLRQIKADSRYMTWLEAFWDRAQEVTPVPIENVRTADPDDQKFLEAAVGGDTDFVVTNDDHLLSVGYIGRAEILTPTSALKTISSEPNNG